MKTWALILVISIAMTSMGRAEEPLWSASPPISVVSGWKQASLLLPVAKTETEMIAEREDGPVIPVAAAEQIQPLPRAVLLPDSIKGPAPAPAPVPTPITNSATLGVPSNKTNYRVNPEEIRYGRERGNFSDIEWMNGPHPIGHGGWISGEYLAWWTSGMTTPPLVSASPPGTPRTAAGVLGQPGATVVTGNSNLFNDLRSGFRIRGGLWLDEGQVWGIEGGFFRLGSANSSDANGSNGIPIISRPFFNAVSQQQDAELVAFPAILAGSATVTGSSDLWGAEGNFSRCLRCGCNYIVRGFLGYRYLHLEDSLQIREDLTASDPNSNAAPFGTQITVIDRFRTTNDFHGGQVGVSGDYYNGRWILGFRGQMALGVTRQELQIDGSTQIVVPGGGSSIAPGGLLAQASNIGSYNRNVFSVVPEVGVRLGYALTPNLRVFAGYNAMWWGNVLRAGDQIDTVVNPTQIPVGRGPGTLVGPARPAVLFQDSSFFAHGITLGAEWHW